MPSITEREVTRRIWRGMKKRCLNPKDKRWNSYGGRGIGIDPRWLDFEEFLKDMGLRPPGMQIERIDNGKGYCRKNCRWATRLDQQNNMRSNRWLEFRGRRMTLAQWARELQVNASSLIVRLRTMSVEEAFTKPFRRLDWVGARVVTCPWCRKSWRSRIRVPEFCQFCRRHCSSGLTYMQVKYRRNKREAALHRPK